MTPPARSGGESARSLLNAPRALKEWVCWRFSSLKTGPSGEGRTGVSRIQGLIRSSARSTSRPTASGDTGSRDFTECTDGNDRTADVLPGGLPLPEPAQVAEAHHPLTLLVPQ